MKAVRGPLSSIRESQRRGDSHSGIRCTRGKLWEEDHYHQEIFRKVISVGMMKASESSHSSSNM